MSTRPAEGRRPRGRLANPRGFSLTEMLISVAIVSIVAAVLLPVLQQTRERAHQSECISNEKQLGLAMLEYVQDNDEHFPDGLVGLDGDRMRSGEGWAGQCMPYIKNPAILRCPDDLTATVPPYNDTVSYGYNVNLVEGGGLWPKTKPAPPGNTMGLVMASDHTVLFFEVSGVTANVNADLEGANQLGHTGRCFSASGNGLDNRLYAHLDEFTGSDNQYATGILGNREAVPGGQFAICGRHHGGSNFVMIDGHVKWLLGANVSSGLNASKETDRQGSSHRGYSAAGTQDPRHQFAATFSIR